MTTVASPFRNSALTIAVIALVTFSLVFTAFAVTGASPSPPAAVSAGVTVGANSPAAATPTPSSCLQSPVPLGADSSYAVLAGSTVVSTGPTSLTGDLGLSPGSSVTGFPPGTVTGVINVDNTPAAEAAANLTVAYNNAATASRDGCTPVTLTDGENLAGLTLTPGLYWSASSVNIEGGDLTLAGAGIYVFQIESTLTTTSGAAITLTGGAQASDIYWQIGTSATIGTTSAVQGTFLAAASITMNTGSSLVGRALADAEVMMGSTTVVVPTPATATNYSVTFTESHLPLGTNWSVTLNGVLNSSTSSTIGFHAVNGTYNFTVGAVAGYLATPSLGIITVDGASVNQPISFGAVLPTTYAVTFSETGLPLGTNWSVVLDGVLNSSTATTIGFKLANGTYGYTVGVVAGHIATPSSGNITVHGAPVVQPIVFTAGLPTTYAVTFTESGLTLGTNWSVILNGVLNSSTTTTIGFKVANGTYNYTVGTIARYTASPAIGNLTVSGAAVGKAITFTPGLPSTYTVNFTESGLTSGTNWSVTLNSVTLFSTTSSIRFTVVNGTFGYTVGIVAGYTAAPLSGNVTVNGANINQAVVFTAGAPAEFAVTFTESGLAIGTNWSVTLGGVPVSSVNTTIVFELVNATWAYSIGHVAGYTAAPLSGNVTVHGAAIGRSIVFTAGAPLTYVVTFTETGLPVGTSWSVTLNGTQRSSTTLHIAFTVPNGTYAFSIAPVPGYGASPISGNLVVHGAAIGQSIVFTAGIPQTFSVTFTEIGLVSGTNWSVILNGIAHSSINSTIAFQVANGTFEFTVGPVANKTANPASGSVTVNGVSVSRVINFSGALPHVYDIVFTESGLPAGTSWGVVLNGGIAVISTTTTVTITVTNGTYGFVVGSEQGYVATPESGNVTVHGAAVAQAVRFAAPIPTTYTVTFTESGLAAGASWAVTLNGVLRSSTTTTVAFAVVSGSYAYSVGTQVAFTASPSSGILAVHTVAVGESIAFTPRAGPGQYTVTFTETGLAPGTTWGVVANETPQSGTSTSIEFVLPNGTYSYVASPVGPWHVLTNGTGTFTVAGGALTVALDYDYASAVTFAETGMAPGTSWMVEATYTATTSGSSSLAVIVGQSWFVNSTGTTALLYLANGSYAWTATASGYQTVSGHFVVGGAQTVSVVTTPISGGGGSTASSVIWWFWVVLGVTIAFIIISLVVVAARRSPPSDEDTT